QAAGGESRRGDFRKLGRPMTRVTGDDSSASGRSFHLSQVSGHPERRLGDRPRIDGSRADFRHPSAAAAGAERNDLPEEGFQLCKLLLTNQGDQRGTILLELWSREPRLEILRSGGRNLLQTDGLIDCQARRNFGGGNLGRV